MRQIFTRPFVLICALIGPSIFVMPVISAENQERDRYFWVYSCRNERYKHFEYKLPQAIERARKLCKDHAEHDEKYNNPSCGTCAQVTTTDGRTPQPDRDF